MRPEFQIGPPQALQTPQTGPFRSHREGPGSVRIKTDIAVLAYKGLMDDTNAAEGSWAGQHGAIKLYGARRERSADGAQWAAAAGWGWGVSPGPSSTVSTTCWALGAEPGSMDRSKRFTWIDAAVSPLVPPGGPHLMSASTDVGLSPVPRWPPLASPEAPRVTKVVFERPVSHTTLV